MKIENYTPAILVTQPLISVRKTSTRKVYRFFFVNWSNNVFIFHIGFKGIRITF